MTEYAESPPLKPLLTIAQQLSISLLLVAGWHGVSPWDCPSGVGSCYTAAHKENSWQILASYPAGRRLPHDSHPTEVAPEADNSEVTRLSASRISQEVTGQQSQPSDFTSRGLSQQLTAPRPPAAASAGSREPLGNPRSGASEGLPHKFEPSAKEELVTGHLPTICSPAELAEYNRKKAEGPSRRPSTLTSPFEIAARGLPPPQAEPSASQGPVLFSTQELLALDPKINMSEEERHMKQTGAVLALYGRGDHSQTSALTWGQRLSLTQRALFLVAVFLPFFLLGPILLLLSRGSRVRRAVESTERISEGARVADEAVREAEGASRLRTAAWRLMLWSIRQSGAAFIKWGQWSSTREDMFPAEVCAVLTQLQDDAPRHSWPKSKAAIEAAFGRSVDQLFESIEHEPMASGSIAQVHKAVMKVGGQLRSMAVKVRHPGVEVHIKQDFQILKPLAALASQMKPLKGLSLKESLAQFSSSMTAQTDLRVEAAHLRRFFRNFAPIRDSVTPPFPLPEFVSEAVLIETFEPGTSVAKFIKTPAAFNSQIVALGVDTYLKMLLTDNFVHTDLHPGNIMVRRRDGALVSQQESAETLKGQLQLILLDFGLAEELTPAVRKHFISFLHMIAAGNGERAAHHILKWSSRQRCSDPAAFTGAMGQLFRQECDLMRPEGIALDAVMKAVLRLAKEFEVSIDSSYAALVVGVVVLVGFATSLDPAVNLMDAAAPAFLQNNLLGKVSGRLYA